MRRIALFLSLFVWLLTVLPALAQEPDPHIGNHCPAFNYFGNRPEWEKRFETNGFAGRMVSSPGTLSVQIENWCETKGQGLLPDYRVQLLYVYRNTPSPKTGDPVTHIAIVDLSTGKVTAIGNYDTAEALPKLSGEMTFWQVDLYGTGKPIWLSLFRVLDSKAQYLQTPEGDHWRVYTS